MSNFQLDARRLLCPLPVIRLQNKIKELIVGDTIEIICTDPGVLHDIPAWCRVHGHEVINIEKKENEIIAVVKKQ
jgi:tRNA 2-thiouridine synthesizing protein A